MFIPYVVNITFGQKMDDGLDGYDTQDNVVTIEVRCDTPEPRIEPFQARVHIPYDLELTASQIHDKALDAWEGNYPSS